MFYLVVAEYVNTVTDDTPGSSHPHKNHQVRSLNCSMHKAQVISALCLVSAGSVQNIVSIVYTITTNYKSIINLPYCQTLNILGPGQIN